ncbi:hypothetical protein NUW58_g7838 [Xylaria curta]|uniref:Uncharacterized protein n=1 Tax=Xylaria curta TaxID=42375 RepID=A0ACC1NFG5_9PEZI|nr:hypothetical protein NUW58_g7838 [Xylaria curta]
MASDTTPLLPQSSREPQAPQGDSHPITLRACHSPWRAINQKTLFGGRFAITAYLASVVGVALKYKLEREDVHSGWRIPFEFSSVSLLVQFLYHLVTLAWTGVHTFQPTSAEPDEDSESSTVGAFFSRLLSPPNRVSNLEHFIFSMLYTVSHVFPWLNGIMYWSVLVPSGHGGFKIPKFPHHHHDVGNSTGVFYDPNKGLFEEDDIKAFSILNIWSITAIIAFVEVAFLNSIRRQSPVVGHVIGTLVAGGLYLAWAGIGKLATNHWGLFFLDPELMGNSTGAAVAAAGGFLLAAPIVFTYMQGLIVMREALTATR